ncbi:MAG: O-antigen ligase family protein [Microcoleaceae cyanobacterium]
MTPQAQFVMLAWLPIVVFGFFRFFPPWKATIICSITAWLFLPQRVAFEFLGLPDFDRYSATSYGVLLAILLYDLQRIRAFKFGWLDVPMFIWCILGPFVTAMLNGLGTYEGMAAILDRTVAYGLPYFFGRVYLTSWLTHRYMAIAMFISGLVYAPLCVIEAVLSPQLHRLVYGYHGIREFAQGVRLGGFRPTVFMRHGLSVGMWMMAATLIGLWLWQAGILKKVLNFPMSFLVAGMIVTLVMVKSTGAYAYFIYGVFILFVAKWLKTSLPLLILIATLIGYLGLAASGQFTSETKDNVVNVATTLAGEQRAASLEFRLDNEELLGEKARKQPIWGWGRFGRNRVYDYDWRGDLVDISITDSMWIQAFGVQGVVGLVSIVAVHLLPAMVTMRRYPAHLWFTPKVAPTAVLNVVIVLFMLDSCLNNQVNPVFSVVSGGLIGILVQPVSTVSKSKKVTSAIANYPRVGRKWTVNKKLPPARAPHLGDN